MLTTLSTLLDNELRTMRPGTFTVIPVTRGSHIPRYNVKVDESANTATYEIALPGYEKSDIEVRSSEGRLTVSSTASDSDSDCSGYVTRMFGRRPFSLSWSFGDANVSEATMVNGVLSIVVLRNVNNSGTVVPIT